MPYCSWLREGWTRQCFGGVLRRKLRVILARKDGKTEKREVHHIKAASPPWFAASIWPNPIDECRSKLSAPDDANQGMCWNPPPPSFTPEDIWMGQQPATWLVVHWTSRGIRSKLSWLVVRLLSTHSSTVRGSGPTTYERKKFRERKSRQY